MTSGPHPTPKAPDAVDRRRFLLGAGMAMVLTGCTNDHTKPTSSTSPSAPANSATSPGASPEPTTTPMPGAAEAARTETSLAAFASAIRHELRSKLSSTDKRLLELLTSAHRAHADVLTQTDPSVIERRPTNKPSTGSPESATGPSNTSPAETPTTESQSPYPVGTDPAKALAKLRSREQAAAKRHRARALHPNGPDDRLTPLTLLWGSLSVAASSYAAALGDDHRSKPKATAKHRTPVRIPNRGQAAQHLVTQCEATIYGFQSGLGRLSGKTADSARSRLATYRRLRDATRTWLADHKITVPDQKPVHRLPVQPTSPATAAKLIATMEVRMLPYFGQWLATADTAADRKTALSTLHTAQESADRWSGSTRVPVWPGWPIS